MKKISVFSFQFSEGMKALGWWMAGALVGIGLAILVSGCTELRRVTPMKGGRIEQHGGGTTNVMQAPENAKETSVLNSTGGTTKHVKLPPGSTYEKTSQKETKGTKETVTEKLTVPAAPTNAPAVDLTGCIDEGSTNEAHGELGPSFPPAADPAAKLKASFAFWRPVQIAGLAAIVGAAVLFYFTKRWKAPAMIAGGGIAAMILAGVVPGHEVLIICILLGTGVLVGIYEAYIHQLIKAPGIGPEPIRTTVVTK